jgi:hypothetical protein
MISFLSGDGFPDVVMPWLDHGIHAVTAEGSFNVMEWIAGSSPAMTTGETWLFHAP